MYFTASVIMACDLNQYILEKNYLKESRCNLTDAFNSARMVRVDCDSYV